MTSKEWDNWTAPEGSGVVACIAAPDGQVVDLIEAARAGAA